MSTSASSRSAAQPAGAGRSASERAGIGAASRARVTAAQRLTLPNSADLSEPQLRSAERARESATTVGAAEFAIVVDDPVAGCARPAPHHRRRPDQAKPSSASAPIARAPASAAESANNNSAKKNCRRRPAAAAPPSRPVQVGLPHERAGIGAASRARVTAASG